MKGTSNIFIYFDRDYSDIYDDNELNDYVQTLKHTPVCPRASQERKHKHDEAIGQIQTKLGEYVIYSCVECGAHYPKKGINPTLLGQAKKKRH